MFQIKEIEEITMKDVIEVNRETPRMSHHDALKYLERRNDTGLMEMFRIISKIK